MIILGALFLALLSFANGANDVSKAIATLAGAKVTSLRKAVLWGTLWTLLGSMSGLYFGSAIIKNITKNIYSTQPDFNLSMALAIAISPSLWVLLATWRKWPVSTTHAVVGALLGAGITALGLSGIAWKATTLKIGLPLLASPLMAIGLAYFLSSHLQKVANQLSRIRICFSPVPKLALANVSAMNSSTTTEIEDCIVCDCDSLEAGLTGGTGLSVNQMHWFTSGLLSFSRGLNDTPKLIAVMLPLMLIGGFGQGIQLWMYLVAGIAMAIGGLLVGTRITKVLGFEVTEMTHSQGFSANAIAAFLVLVASKFGLPVSTTHVSSCSIMGQGLSDKSPLNWSTIKSMLFAWLITVPTAGLFATLIYYIPLGK